MRVKDRFHHKCIKCGEIKLHLAKGMCRECYNKNYFKTKEGYQKYMNNYNKNPKHRFKNLIRQKTFQKYGKLPEGYQYHHTTEPYDVDDWIGITKEDHDKLRLKGLKGEKENTTYYWRNREKRLKYQNEYNNKKGKK